MLLSANGSLAFKSCARSEDVASYTAPEVQQGLTASTRAAAEKVWEQENLSSAYKNEKKTKNNQKTIFFNQSSCWLLTWVKTWVTWYMLAPSYGMPEYLNSTWWDVKKIK